MRAIVASIMVSSLLASTAFAADAGQVGPLAPGKPAGVKKADIEAGGVLLVGSILVLAAGIAVLASNTQGDGKNTNAPTTTP